MNVRFLFFVFLTISSTILGMNSDLRAMVRQCEREQVQAELERYVESEEKQKEESDYDLTLYNGYQLSFNFFLKEYAELEKLRTNNYEVFSELIKKVQNSNYEIKENAIVAYLKDEYLLLPDGKIQESVRNIILNVVCTVNGIFRLDGIFIVFDSYLVA